MEREGAGAPGAAEGPGARAPSASARQARIELYFAAAAAPEAGRDDPMACDAAEEPPQLTYGGVSASLRSLNLCLNLSHRQAGGGWQPRRATMQHCAASCKRQAFAVVCGADAAALSGAPPRKTATHTIAANAGGELLVAATPDGLSIFSAAELRRAAEDHARFGTTHPSRVRHFAGVGPALLQPVTHAVRPSTKLAKCAWCPDVGELLASGGSGGGWLHYCRPGGAVDSWPLPCSPGVSGWTGLAAVEWLPGRRRALVGSSASNGVLVWDSGEGGGRRGTASLDSKKLGRADCLAALPGGDLVMGGCGGGKLVIWDLRMASSSVRNFGAAAKAVLHQVDVARRVEQYYDKNAAAAAAPAGAGAAAGAAAAAAAASAGGWAAGGPPAARGGGCFFSQLLPCPSDARLLAFVQTNMQVGLLDTLTGEVLDHASTSRVAFPQQIAEWDARAAALLGTSPAALEAAPLGAPLGFGRPEDLRPACVQSCWGDGGRVLYTAGTLWESPPRGDAAGAAAGGLQWAADGGGADSDVSTPRQLPTLAAVRLHQPGRPVGCGVVMDWDDVSRGDEERRVPFGGRDFGRVRHVPTSHHASAVYQDADAGALLLGTGTPLLLHVR